MPRFWPGSFANTFFKWLYCSLVVGRVKIKHRIIHIKVNKY